MVTKFSGIATILLILFSACSNQKEALPVTGIVERIAPQFADDIVFEQMDSPSGKDIFELESLDNGKILIRGNHPISMAYGFNHYLKYYCMTSVSWFADQPVQLPEVLPEVPVKIRKEARVDKRFFLNYCTYSYTMPFWEWRDWERLIDWMALNGINITLAITGQESIWYKVWRDFGLSDLQIREYFTGPAHIPFHRMSLLDRWGGPLPHSWIEHEQELQKKILAREREFGITPVLQAFSGHVPEELKEIYPDAKISKLGDWVGFDEQYHSHFLDPMDTLFFSIQKAFLEEQTRQFGTDHLYGADPFVEIKPPSWDLDYLTKLSASIYESMTETDPEAEWLQMAWIFYFDKEWSGERIKSFLTAVPQGQMTLLDYFCEYEEIWKTTESFFQQPYFWCYLGNFGGNTMLAGNLEEVNRRIDHALTHGGDNLAGIGSTLEGLDVNPLAYEFVFEKAWESDTTDFNVWMDHWADRRCGSEDESVREAWHILFDKIYSKMPRLSHGTLTNGRPAFTGYGHPHWDHVVSMINPDIATADLFYAWELLLKAEDQSRDAYQYDIVNVGRQVLADHFMVLRDSFTSAYREENLELLMISGKQMLELMDDLDRLLASHSSFLLGDWLQDARKYGTNPDEADYYEKNARNIITTWGGEAHPLTDYANRNWAGLTKTYYAGRWLMFIEEVIESVEKGDPFDEEAFLKKITAFEWDWVERKEEYPHQPVGNSVEIARQLMEKYRSQIVR